MKTTDFTDDTDNENVARHLCVSIRLLFALCLLDFALSARAAQLQKLSLPEMVEHADLVVAAQCEKGETAWLGKKIYTIATVRVIRAAS